MVKNLPVNAGDIGSIPELGGSPRGGNGNPLQYSHSSILAWEIPCTEEPGGLHTVHGVARTGQDLLTQPPPPYKYLSFSMQLIALSIMLSEFIHFVANGQISFSVITEQYSIVYIYIYSTL